MPLSSDELAGRISSFSAGLAKLDTLSGSELLAQATQLARIENAYVEQAKARDKLWTPGSERAEEGFSEDDILKRYYPAAEIVKLYARRFTIEETFRDIKDNHFGMGLRVARIGVPARRDRLLLLAAITQALLTLLGAAGENCGLDRTLKANTVKKRTMSLYNQGVCWFRAIPNMREERLVPLMRAFAQLIQDHAAFRDILGVI
jgi:hypothetical protein